MRDEQGTALFGKDSSAALWVQTGRWYTLEAGTPAGKLLPLDEKVSKCFSTFCWENCVFSLCYLGPFVEKQLTIHVSISSWTLFCSLGLYVHLFSRAHCLNYCPFIRSLDLR